VLRCAVLRCAVLRCAALCRYDFKARTYTSCELFECVPPLLAEFTLRGTNPTRKLKHRLMPFLPEARLYNRCVKVGRAGRGSPRVLLVGRQDGPVMSGLDLL